MNFRFLFDNAACSIFFCSASEKQDTSFSFVFGRLILSVVYSFSSPSVGVGRGLKRSRQFESCFSKNRSKCSSRIQIFRERREPQDMATKKHKTYKILCFLCFVAFSYYKDVYVRQNLVFKAIFESVSDNFNLFTSLQSAELSNRSQLDISSLSSRFQLNAGICFVPRISDCRWVVSLHCKL